MFNFNVKKIDTLIYLFYLFMVIMEDFENSLNYVSQIDNAYTEENQELIINSKFI